MKIKKQAGNVLLILAVCFVAVFAIAIIFVNNWLRQSLKEETANEKQPAPILNKTQHRQVALEPGNAVQQAPAGVKNKSATPENPAVAGNKVAEPRVIMGERILAD